MTTQKLIRPSEMAKALDVSEHTLKRWRQEGTGPEYIKLGAAKNAPIRYLPVQRVAEASAG